jgi:hypothetical protein
MNTVEGFYSDKYVNNEINTRLKNNIANLGTINLFKKPNQNDIKTNLESNLELNNPISESNYDKVKKDQSDALRSLESQLYEIQNDKIFANDSKNTTYHSIKSLENSQPINLTPLSNNKYLISLNGKCLESDNFNKNTIQPCNSQNPNQYFDLFLITNQNDYQRHTLGEIHHQSINKSIKYPFHLAKSEAGNCLGTKDGLLTIGACNLSQKQRWDASEKPILC